MTVVRQQNGYAIALHDGQPIGGHRPSVDVLFESLLPLRELERHIVLLTGMGSDGARTMKALRDDGAATTIAEAESTCIVYGMPRTAIELGGAEWVLPLDAIAERLVHAVGA
jgi:two-component system chemotaxis response regulator CheB